MHKSCTLENSDHYRASAPKFMMLGHWEFNFEKMTAVRYENFGYDPELHVLMRLNDMIYVDGRYFGEKKPVWKYPDGDIKFARKVFDAYGDWCLERALGLGYADET